MELRIQNITCGYGRQVVLKNISLNLKQGEIVCLLGPNGVGKTTAFRSILGFLPLLEGEILIDDTPTQNMSKKELSKAIGYVPQSHEPPFSFSVPDVIVMGRTARMGAFSNPGIREYLIVNKVMEMLGISYLKEKTYTQISGGERQMVLIARALVQNSRLLVMDEPTANLDYGNQVRVLDCIKNLSNLGLGVLMTTHSPDHAFLCSTKVILITKDKTVIEGPVDEVVTEENLRKAYGVDVRIVETTRNDGQVIKTCIPMLESFSL